MGSVVTVTDDTFATVVLGNDRPVLVDFWAEWCRPCVAVSRALDELSDEYGDRMVFAKIDADANPEAVRAYGVMAMPTLLIFRAGELVGSTVGARPKTVLRRTIDELI